MPKEFERRIEVRNLARSVWELPNLVILDTETSGLGADAEVISIAVIDKAGLCLLNENIKPARPLSADALNFHGFKSNDELAGRKTWLDVHADVKRILDGKMVGIYNSEYDMRILNSSSLQYALPKMDIQNFCIMELFAKWFGNWSKYHRSYTYQKLVIAAAHFGMSEEKIKELKHTALGDCQMTLYVLKGMAGVLEELGIEILGD